MAEEIVLVDFGVGLKKPVAVINADTKEIIEEFEDGLSAAMWLGACSELYSLTDRQVDYSNDDDFDKWLEESSIGGDDD